MNSIKKFIKNNIIEISYLVIAIITIVLLSTYLSSLFKITCLMGDDLKEAIRIEDLNFFQYVFSREGNRFRPFSNIFVYFEFLICKYNVFIIKIFNIISFSLVGFVICFTLHKITKKYIIPLFATVLVIYSRFSWYNITQVLGMMENVSIILLILICYFMYVYLKSKKLDKYIWINILYFLILFYHERYFVLFIPLFITFVFCENNWKDRLIKSSIPVVIFLFYLFLKTVILRLPFAVDTGGSSNIEFNFLEAFKKSWISLLNIAQLPISEVHLVGINYDTMDISYRIIALIISILTIGLLAIIFIHSIYIMIRKKDKNFFLYFLFLYVALAFYIGGVSSSFRVEMRFLYSGYCLLIYILSVYFSKFNFSENLKLRIPSISVSSLFLCFTVVFTNYMSKNIYPYYYIASQSSTGDYYKKELIDSNLDELKEKKLILIVETNNQKKEFDLFLKQFNLKNGYEIYLSDITIANKEFDENKLLIAYNSGKFYKLNKKDSFFEMKDSWLLNNENQFICYSLTGIISLDFFVPENFIDIKYSIYINDELVDELSDYEKEQAIHYEYRGDNVQDKFFTFKIKSDKTFNPSLNGGTDVRDLQMYVLNFQSDAYRCLYEIPFDEKDNKLVFIDDSSEVIDYLNNLSVNHFNSKVEFCHFSSFNEKINNYNYDNVYLVRNNQLENFDPDNYIYCLNSPFWTIGYNTDFLCYSNTGKIHLEFYVPLEFINDMVYEIRINGELIEKYDSLLSDSSYCFEYDSTNLKGQCFILSIISDKVYIPSEHGSQDQRSLQMYIINFNSSVE